MYTTRTPSNTIMYIPAAGVHKPFIQVHMIVLGGVIPTRHVLLVQCVPRHPSIKEERHNITVVVGCSEHHSVNTYIERGVGM
jgi:hypothetical protein